MLDKILVRLLENFFAEFNFVRAMSARSSNGFCLESKFLKPALGKNRFRARFQRSLSTCLKKHFSVAECFGLIWEETLETCALSESEQLEIYHELLAWAKNLPKAHLSASYSRLLFTSNSHVSTTRALPEQISETSPAVHQTNHEH
jgi:hypothetical protein